MSGPGIIVEVKNVVFSRRDFFLCPTTTNDTILDTVWILGGIGRTPPANFFLARVKNRTIDNIPQLCIRLSVIGAFFTRMNVRRIRLLLLR